MTTPKEIQDLLAEVAHMRCDKLDFHPKEFVMHEENSPWNKK